MYCQNCGTENSGASKFCAECGAELTQASAPVQQQPAYQSNNTVNTNNAYQPQNGGYQTQTAVYPVKKKKSLLPIFIIVGVIVTAVVIFFIWALSAPDLSVEDVKTGTLNGFDTKTIGNMFEDYFNNCSWDAFTANENVSISVVEFIGYKEDFDGRNVKITVQFTQDSDHQSEEEFSIYYVGYELSNGNKGSLSDSEISNMIYCIFHGRGLEEWL